MARNKIINSLTDEERNALALCGIQQDEQLARIGPHALLRDMQAANALLPDSLENLPEFHRLEYICLQAAEALNLPIQQTAPRQQGGMPARPGIGLPFVEEPKAHRYSEATGRMLVDDNLGVKKAQLLDELRRKEDPRDFAHSIRCQHPIAIYLNAWVTWLLVGVIGILGLAVVGILIGIEVDLGTNGIIFAGCLAAVVVTYAILLNMATCSTCRISIFSFRRYPKHRNAHRLPLLGRTLATALVVMFLFRFRCPSCGTPQKLLGKHRHRKR